jgi:hypothetical protein
MWAAWPVLNQLLFASYLCLAATHANCLTGVTWHSDSLAALLCCSLLGKTILASKAVKPWTADDGLNVGAITDTKLDQSMASQQDMKCRYQAEPVTSKHCHQLITA